ncbi:RNA-directed RNA polymerase L, partial [Frankliniella fusca]
VTIKPQDVTSKKRTCHEFQDSESEFNKDKHSDSYTFECERADNKSDESETEDREKFKDLEEFVDKKVLDKLSYYELVNLLGKLNNWKQLSDMGAACSSVPNLGIPLKSNVVKASNNKDSSKKKPNKQSMKHSESVAHKKRKTSEISIEDSSRDLRILKSRQDSKKPDDTTKTRAVNQSNSSSNCNEKDSDSDWDGDQRSEHSSESDDSNESGESDDDNVKENLLKPNFPMLDKDELSTKLPNLPSFDVENILLKDDKAKKWVPHLREGYLLPTTARKLVFRVLVHYLINSHAGNIKDVNAHMKHGMAKSIVTTYVQYQSPTVVTNVTPWAHIYNPKKNSGNLANIMKRAQTALPLADRVRKGKVKKQKSKAKKKQQLTSKINIEALAVMMPNSDNKEEIFSGMEKSFDVRCEDRGKGLSITELLEKFPHFLNYSGELILLEFKLLYPKAEDMCVAMTPLIPKVIENWKDTRINPTCKENVVKAFMILASRLPHAIARKMGPAFPQEKELIVVVPRNSCVETLVEEKRAASKKAVQPYLIAVQGSLTSDILKLFLVLDSKLIELTRMPLIRAIDVLFKSYIAFNVHYPESWKQFFRFLQTCFYKFLCSEKDSVPPSSIELYSRVTAL